MKKKQGHRILSRRQQTTIELNLERQKKQEAPKAAVT
jgi:hypothetical protein